MTLERGRDPPLVQCAWVSAAEEVLRRQLVDAARSAGTVLVGSGLAAISIALLAFLRSGDHLLVPDSVYRPTRNLCDTMLNCP